MCKACEKITAIEKEIAVIGNGKGLLRDVLVVTLYNDMAHLKDFHCTCDKEATNG